MDSDSSGNISYSEFLGIVTEKKNLLTDQNLRATFQTIDYDNNGSISLEELKKVFNNNGT